MNIPLTPVRFLRRAVEQYPDRTALVCGKKRFTYREFGERVARLAGALGDLGVQPGDRVAFLSTNCHRLLEAYYGVLEAGAVLLPLNIRLSPAELAYNLNDSGARLLFLEEHFLPQVESFREQVGAVESYRLFEGRGEAAPSWLGGKTFEELLSDATPRQRDVMEFEENSLAELFYTSGTSADPKGVMLTHRTLYLHALYVAVGLASKPAHVYLHTIPLYHANGWGQAHALTIYGGKHVMIHRFDPFEVLRLIEEEKVQSLNMVPTMATALVNTPVRSRFDVSSLERITLGGAAASPTLVQAVEETLGCLCHAGYGLTETSPVLSLGEVKERIRCEGSQRYTRQAMAGFAIPGVELRVFDEDDNELPHDGKSMGEVVTRSDVVMEGYWQQPQETARVMRNGWFHTGDMGVIDEHNYVQILDRKKEIIISGGENISSQEIEKALVAHPGVYEVAVIPVPDEKRGEVPKALVVRKPDSNSTEDELIEFARSRLARYKVPKSVDFLDTLPKGGTGKILKKELRKIYGEESGEQSRQVPTKG